MRSIQRIIGLLSLSVLIAGGVYVTTRAETRPSGISPEPSASDDCAKKRARGRKCDDDDNRNGNRNGNRNSNSNRNDNGNRNGNNNSGDDNR